MAEIIYRSATANDLEPIKTIVRCIWTMGMDKRLEDLYGPQGGQSWDELTSREIAEAVSCRLHQCIVAEVDGQIAGWVTWSIDNERMQGRVGYNGVAPEYRGLGLGTTLVSKAIEKIRETGVPLALVVTGLDDGHAAARHVYEKAGFQEVGKSVVYAMKLR